MASLTLTTPPSIEPLFASDLRDVRRVDDGAETFLLDTWLQTAREDVEAYCGVALLTQTWTLKLDGFPDDDDFFELPRNPVQSITSIQYVDANGVTQTMSSSDYRLIDPADPVGGSYRVTLGFGKSWPTTRDDVNAVTVVFVAGYTERRLIPPALLSAILLIAGNLHEQRDETIVGTIFASLPTVTNLLARYRRRWF
jgi:uncharacterized phiE125 gp8 family phage protein